MKVTLDGHNEFSSLYYLIKTFKSSDRIDFAPLVISVPLLPFTQSPIRLMKSISICNGPNAINIILSRGYIVQFTPHLPQVRNTLMNVLWIKTFLKTQLIKNKQKHISFQSLISDLKIKFLHRLYFTFSFYFQHIFSLYLPGRSIYTYFRTIFFNLKSKQSVVNCMCWGAKTSVLLYVYINFECGYIDILYISRIGVKENKTNLPLWPRFTFIWITPL